MCDSLTASLGIAVLPPIHRPEEQDHWQGEESHAEHKKTNAPDDRCPENHHGKGHQTLSQGHSGERWDKSPDFLRDREVEESEAVALSGDDTCGTASPDQTVTG